MSSEWPTVRLGDHVEACLGKMLDAQKNRGTFQPYLGNSNVRWGKFDINGLASMRFEAHEEERYGLRYGDLVVCEGGEPGRCAIWRDTIPGMKIQKALHRVRGKASLDTQYLYYWFMHAGRTGALEPYFTGTTIKHLTGRALSELKIPLPSITTQQSIGKVLNSLDEKIEINGRINQTLQAIAQAVFKSWFVDFDPVKAKIAAKQHGYDPLRAAMSTISGKPDFELDFLSREQFDSLAIIAMLFPDEMEESGLGEVPKGWSYGSLGDICSFTAGSAFKHKHQGSTEGEYPFIKVSDMNLAGNEVFIQSANNYVSTAQHTEMKAKLHPAGATVFAKIGVALISNRRRLLTTPTIIDNNMMSASPVQGKSGSYFLYSILSTIDFNTLVSGTALPYLNVSDLKRIPVVRPPAEVCNEFELKASSIFAMIETLASQSLTLAATRDYLLPKLLSSERNLFDLAEE